MQAGIEHSTFGLPAKRNKTQGFMKKKKPVTVTDMAVMGGKARAKALSKEKRVEIARNAIRKRWENKASRFKGENRNH